MSDVLRVLAICTEDPELLLGGMGRHVRELYRHMSQRDDVKIDLLTMGPGPLTKEYDGYNKHRFAHLVPQKPPMPGLRSVLQSDLQMMRTMLALIAEGHRWDVIHAHEWSSVQVAQTIRDALKIPIVSTMHLCMKALRVYDRPMGWKQEGEETWDEMDLWVYNQEGKLLIENSELILCSEAYVRIAKETYPLSVVGKEPNMIYNGISLEEWYPGAGNKELAREKHQVKTFRPVALFVGRIATMKGIEYLLKAINDRDVDWQIVIAGEVNADTGAEDWYVTKALRRAERQFPERVRWIGFQRDQDLKDMYELADAVIMPSTHEPFGIVALEAMAMGTPLIATDKDGLGEIVRSNDETFAEIIPARSSDAVNAALVKLRPEKARADLRARGLRRARDFGWTEIAERTVGVYHKAVNSCMPH